MGAKGLAEDACSGIAVCRNLQEYSGHLYILSALVQVSSTHWKRLKLCCYICFLPHLIPFPKQYMHVNKWFECGFSLYYEQVTHDPLQAPGRADSDSPEAVGLDLA